MNAAVESARAGEQGRGFAVVAAEVRALAQRSAEATDKIKALIAGSSENVSDSSVLVAKAEQAVDAAAVQIRHVIELIVSVAAASSEQEAGVQSMTRALSHLDSVTQENAALVQKGKRAAESFESASDRLVDSTRAFRLPEQKTADDEITIGSFRTLVRNLGMGPIVRVFVVLPIAISVSLSNGLGAIVFALPLLVGVLLTFLAAFAPLHAGVATAGSDVSALVTAGLPIVTAAAFLVGTYLYFSFTEWQNRGAAWMQNISTRLASGDLTWNIKLVESAEADRIEVYGINRALFEIKRNFVNVVSEVRASADAIAAGAHEIAQGYNNLSQRTETQAATLEETAASIEELTATVRQNAEHCRAANSGVEEVRTSAEQASHAMQQVTNTMAGLEQSAKQMVEFIGIVESIAFQTNILALNAAVEAARAGDQGRGFAVVAAEVRALAQRSAEATEQIKTLIDDSVQRVSEGASIISQAEQTVGRAVAGIHEAAELIESIATTSADQSSGMERIASALARLEGSTQQNAALVEEGAAVSASFEHEGARLVEGMRVFRLDTTEHVKEAVPPPDDVPEENTGNAPSLHLIPRTGTG